MIVADTNVISEMMRDQPDPHVLAWADTVGRLHTTTITLAEIGYGIARLPAGARRDRLGSAADEVALLAAMSTDYYERIEQARGPQPSPSMLGAIARAPMAQSKTS